jgi:uncharacterized damage-inducible protein DinB
MPSPTSLAITHAVAVGLVTVFGFSSVSTQNVSMHAELVRDWSALKTTVARMAAEMPADNYAFRPTPGQQSFGERVVHIAAVNVGLLGSIDASGTAKPTIDPKVTTKDTALKALDASFDYGIALLQQQSDATLLQPVATPPAFLGPSSRVRIVNFLIGHTWDIYGQLAVYLRLNGLVPPASQRM